MDHVPYVYIIKNKTTGLKYIGVRYAKGCHPLDLWVSYFTSSSSVKKLIEEFGTDDFAVKVLHRYPNDPAAAVQREAKYFPLIKKRDDYLNMTYSNGYQDLRISSKGGKVGGALVHSRGIGIFRDQEERRSWASKAGKAGGAKQRDLGIGIHGLSKQERIKNSRKGNESCKAQKKGRWNKNTQSVLGKKGGPKNRGFIWINDGLNDIKYTQKMQNITPVDAYLSENPRYRIGRVQHEKLQCPYCLKAGSSLAAMHRWHFEKCKKKESQQ